MTKHAELPMGLVQTTIGHLQVGEVAYAVPWAMEVDHERRCWLNPNHSAHGRPEGTVRMRVERRADGYHVAVPRDERYTPSRDAQVHKGLLPVVELLDG